MLLLILIANSLVLFTITIGETRCVESPMQKVFQFEKRSYSEESCERRSLSARSDPSNESKNSVTLLILNCESSYACCGAVDGKLSSLCLCDSVVVKK